MKSLQASNQKAKKGQLPTMGMFTAKNEKSTVENDQVQEKPSEETKPKTTEDKPSNKSSKPSGSMLSFFGKQVSGKCETPK